MSLYGFYEEMDSPVRVNDIYALEWKCKLLNMDHLQMSKDSYLGFYTDFLDLKNKLTELLNLDFKIISIRRHCISGVIVDILDQKCFVIGVGLSNPTLGKKYYIDFLVHTEDASKGYIDDQPIPEEIFISFMRSLNLLGKFRRRDKTAQVWYPAEIFKYKEQ